MNIYFALDDEIFTLIDYLLVVHLKEEGHEVSIEDNKMVRNVLNDLIKGREDDSLTLIRNEEGYFLSGEKLSLDFLPSYLKDQFKGFSNDIREGKRLYLNKENIDYIVKNELYFIPRIKAYLTLKRYLHSLSVADLSFSIALANSLDPYKAYLAALYHDIGKYVDINIYKDEIIRKEGANFYNDIPNWAYHQFISKIIACKEFKIQDKEILDAIEYHTTGKKYMTKLDKIVFAADKIEPLRGFDSSDLIKAMKEDVDNGFKEVLKANREYIKEHSKEVAYEDKLTLACYESYL